jgi:1-acyl-sn-glycerol-3-phosphate acyltransferase
LKARAKLANEALKPRVAAEDSRASLAPTGEGSNALLAVGRDTRLYAKLGHLMEYIPPDAKPVTRALLVRSVLYAVGQGLLSVFFSVAAMLALLLPYRLRYALVSRWTHMNLWWLEKTCGLRHMVRGEENIPAQPVIIFCKHESAWETLALQRYFTPQVWVIKRELLWIPFFGWGLATLRPIAIDRSAGRAGLEQILAQGRERLKDGCWVVIFPEGTRVAPGERRRYRQGGALLAETTGVPVLPVAHNAGDFWPRNSFIKYPGTIELRIGPVIETTGRSANEINRLAEDWIESAVNDIRGTRARTPSTRSQNNDSVQEHTQRV